MTKKGIIVEAAEWLANHQPGTEPPERELRKQFDLTQSQSNEARRIAVEMRAKMADDLTRPPRLTGMGNRVPG